MVEARGREALTCRTNHNPNPLPFLNQPRCCLLSWKSNTMSSNHPFASPSFHRIAPQQRYTPFDAATCVSRLHAPERRHVVNMADPTSPKLRINASARQNASTPPRLNHRHFKRNMGCHSGQSDCPQTWRCFGPTSLMRTKRLMPLSSDRSTRSHSSYDPKAVFHLFMKVLSSPQVPPSLTPFADPTVTSFLPRHVACLSKASSDVVLSCFVHRTTFGSQGDTHGG